MTEEEKKKTVQELYAEFLKDLDHLDAERLAFMKRVVARIEREKMEKAEAALER